LLHLKQQQNRSNEDMATHLVAGQLEVFSTVGKPLPTSLLAGVPVQVVAARLGHADPAVTLRVYAHVLREHAAGVGDIFAQAVNGSR
jgi:integrase